MICVVYIIIETDFIIKIIQTDRELPSLVWIRTLCEINVFF